VRRLAGDARRRERLATGARTRAARRYTAARMAADYIELYHELARGGEAKRRRADALAAAT
ncbi:MAG: hypothetical protein AVDCRST_MAG89-3220, partial [uncultured Gemmatimonadetes bacterium]